jgi:hypothetical protein
MDSAYPRRILPALAISAFIHGLIIGAGPLQPLHTHEEQKASTPIAIELQTPPPLPSPVPIQRPVRTPRPKPTIVIETPQPIIVPRRAAVALATAPPAVKIGGSASNAELAKPVASAPPNGTRGEGEGVAAGGSGTGAGPGAGSGGAGGTGTGTGSSDQPCGAVGLVPATAPAIGRSGIWLETIRVTISFGDGHSENGVFPYPFIYQNEAADPWSPPNLSKEMTVRVPLPPPGIDLGAADRAVLMTLRYTRLDGTTLLPPCPGAQP